MNLRLDLGRLDQHAHTPLPLLQLVCVVHLPHLLLNSMQELHSALQDHHPGSLKDRGVLLGGSVAQGLLVPLEGFELVVDVGATLEVAGHA
eukprot:CAMPEP_0173202368 /NCGR_PEP_ID=MMETSP1141-20130122/18926_1 /TAXON_ID=483371 /ORGANISM="non described non described, Strain CCMP2298" /LENGTH=90 /DNA_ID=CAMNT_0014127709 /DNA_START=376 /DNA_END=648 /DNA_ORIENTATION=+